MNANVSTILLVGAIAVAIGLSALTLLVRRDLAPAGLRQGGGQIFLGAALGLGVIAASIKLVIILALSSLSHDSIAAILPAPAQASDEWNDVLRQISAAGMRDPTAARVGPWEALPGTAPAPADNPTTLEKVVLGKRLFNDKALSLDGSVACASCHDLEGAAGADARPRAIGITLRPGERNTPTVFNTAFQTRLFWDGRVGSLEEQAVGPLLNPEEMGMPSVESVEQRVAADPRYAAEFTQAFGTTGPATIDQITKAIAAYERTLITPDTPYDHFIRGDDRALSNAQKRGMELFSTLGCIQCHAGPNFSGASRFGTPRPYAMLMAGGTVYDQRYRLSADRGRAQDNSDHGVWRVPSLRNVAVTGPYFHNGSVSELSEAVRVMATLQLNALIGDRPPEDRLWLKWSEERRSFEKVERRVVSDQDVSDLVQFLNALTSERFAHLIRDPLHSAASH